MVTRSIAARCRWFPASPHASASKVWWRRTSPAGHRYRDARSVPSIAVKLQRLVRGGLAHTPGGNIQAVLAPDGFPLWVSEVEPGSVHDLTAARAHALPASTRPPRSACRRLPTPATRRRPSHSHPGQAAPRRAELDIGARTRDASSGSCAAWANAGSPCSPALAHSPARHRLHQQRSATSPGPALSSPISNTATSHEFL